MLLNDAPSKIFVPFAESGGKNNIPIPSQTGVTPGAASYIDGFPPLTRTPLVSGGVPPSGLDMNGILYSMSAIDRWASVGGGFVFDAGLAGYLGGYPNGAKVLRSDGKGYWQNTADNNTTNPESGGGLAAGWRPSFASSVGAVVMSNANVTLTPLQYGCPIIVISGAVTANLNLIFPDLVASWVVINNATGGFTITAKTASGTGVPVANALQIGGDGVNIYSVSAANAVQKTGDTMTGDLSINANLFVSGNVGIGNSSPSFKLDMVGPVNGVRYTSADPVSRMRMDSSAGSSIGGGLYEAANGGTLVGGFGAESAITGVASNSVGISAAMSGGHVDVFTNGSATLVARFLATGQLSLGISNSFGKLSVVTTGGDRSAYFGNSTASGVMQLSSNTSAGTWRTLSGGGMTWGTDGSTGDSEAFRIIPERFSKFSDSGSYGGVAGLGNLIANQLHQFQSSQNNTILASISSDTGAQVTCFDAFLPTGAAGKFLQASLNAVPVFAVNADGSITSPSISGSASRLATASGAAPSYSSRGFVNFDGTGTPAIRSSGNVTSITDNGTGDYTVNFTTALPAGYAFSVTAGNSAGIGTGIIGMQAQAAPTTTALRIGVHQAGAGALDVSQVSAVVFA